MSHGLSYDEADKIIVAFYNEFSALLKISYILGKDEEEVFGYDHAEENPKYGFRTPGAYYPKEACIRIAASANSSEEDLRKTLRHELLGHFGLNTFIGNEKRSILDSILRFKGSGKEPEKWQYLSELYPGADRDRLAEEYFAQICEDLETAGPPLPQPILEKITTTKNHIPSQRELVGLANYIRQGFRDNTLFQKNFPKGNNDSFRFFSFSSLYLGEELPRVGFSETVSKIKGPELDYPQP